MVCHLPVQSRCPCCSLFLEWLFQIFAFSKITGPEMRSKPCLFWRPSRPPLSSNPHLPNHTLYHPPHVFIVLAVIIWCFLTVCVYLFLIVWTPLPPWGLQIPQELVCPHYSPADAESLLMPALGFAGNNTKLTASANNPVRCKMKVRLN